LELNEAKLYAFFLIYKGLRMRLLFWVIILGLAAQVFANTDFSIRPVRADEEEQLYLLICELCEFDESKLCRSVFEKHFDKIENFNVFKIHSLLGFCSDLLRKHFTKE